MNKMKLQFKESWQELKNVKNLVVTAMLIAVGTILGFYTIQVTDYLQIGFSFTANELTGMLFGPVVGGIMAGAANIIEFMIKPSGPFFFGFTFSAIMSGIIYGIILYKKPISFKRILCANLTVAVVVNMLMTTCWIAMLYGTPFMVLLPVRAVKQLLMVPIETMMFYVFAQALKRTKILSQLRVEKAR